jgi:large subunit ribosomal protein L13e
MVKHNNVIPNQHFKKKWQFRVKTWFNQPARKQRRRAARADKAAKAFPRPAAGALRPVVHGQTVKYNAKERLGRGFTRAELKEAGIPLKMAPTLGIAVDARRRNRSLEGLQANAARLKAYRANLVVFPRDAKKPRKFEASKEEAAAAAAQLKGAAVMPITKAKAALEKVAVSGDMKAFNAYATLRLERMNARMVGIRAKRAKEAEAADKEANA